MRILAKNVAIPFEVQNKKHISLAFDKMPHNMRRFWNSA